MILVVDYGMGNLRSVTKALEKLGAKACVSNDAAAIKNADKLVLPGVGSFGHAMEELDAKNLREPLMQFQQSGKPFLGICLGLQLFFEESEESPGVKGLGFFPGKIKRFQSNEDKVPHMGWNLTFRKKDHPLLQGIDDPSYFYYVHSFYADGDTPEITLATCDYANTTFSAIVGSKSTFATQFHPEKSQQMGLQILKNFVEF